MDEKTEYELQWHLLPHWVFWGCLAALPVSSLVFAAGVKVAGWVFTVGSLMMMINLIALLMLIRLVPVTKREHIDDNL